MNAADILEQTADVIETRGHAKYVLEEPLTGAVCLMGAINVVTTGRPNVGPCFTDDLTDERDRATNAMFIYLGLGAGPCPCGCGMSNKFNPVQNGRQALVNWNNEDERESYEVVNACRHTAKVLRG